MTVVQDHFQRMTLTSPLLILRVLQSYQKQFSRTVASIQIILTGKRFHQTDKQLLMTGDILLLAYTECLARL